MAYTIPTPADVKSAYPQFAGVADATVQNALDLGGLVIDETWPEPAFPLAYKLYAAHVLTLGGHGSQATGQAAEGLAANVKMRQAGDHKIEFFDTASGAVSGTSAWYAASTYGAEFRMMQRRYFGGPRVI